MSSYQKVIICGNVGNDPEIRSFNNGGKIANFSVATSEKWKDKQTGQQREKTEWHRISATGEGLVGIIERYMKKGTKVLIDGKLQTRKWQDRDGNERYTTEVTVGYGGRLVLLGGGQNGGGGSRSYSGGGYGQDNKDAADDQTSENFDLDDEIPF